MGEVNLLTRSEVESRLAIAEAFPNATESSSFLFGARAAATIDALAKALLIAKKALTHDVPGSCWANGPDTGDLISDLVVCPGCAALAEIDSVLRQTCYLVEGR